MKHCYPQIASEWSSRNEERPEDVLFSTEAHYWWKCSNCGNEWKSNVRHRTVDGSGCPRCNKCFTTSILEIRIFLELQSLFNGVVLRPKIGGIECDVYVGQFNLAIESDGWFWHKNKEDQDIKKNENLQKAGITVIRVRENPLGKIGDDDIIVEPKEAHLSVMKKLMNAINKKTNAKVDYDLLLVSDLIFRSVVRRYRRCTPKTAISFSERLVREWDNEKNGVLTPDTLGIGATVQVWWRCAKGHEWQSTPNSRWRNGNVSGCPYCSGKRVSLERSLLTRFPLIALEWHPVLNGFLRPEDVMGSAGKKVWWLCPNGHSWSSTINNRVRGRVSCKQCRNL